MKLVIIYLQINVLFFQVFDAQVVILEHKSIICAGYSAVMHIHCAAEEVTVRVQCDFNSI